MSTIISAESPDTPDARALIFELKSYLEPLYPRESRHGLSVAQLVQEQVVFFITRYDGAAAGCGGVKLIPGQFGEIKRMFVRPQFRGLGLAKAMLDHLAGYAREHELSLLRLETGIYQGEAIGLYEKLGFYRIPPFEPYHDDPLSLFYEKRIVTTQPL